MVTIFTGALAFADDVVLISPTVSAMSKMLNICEHLSKEYKVSFNPDKSKHMVSGSNDAYPILFIDKLPICKVNTFEYLGHGVGQNALNISISNSISRFQTEVNLLMTQVGTAFPDARHKLFKT